MCDNASYWLMRDNEQLMDENKRLNEELETAHNKGAREALTRLTSLKGDICARWFSGESQRRIARFRDDEYPAPAVADTPTPDVRTQRQDLHDELDRTFPVYADFERFVRSAVADTGEREMPGAELMMVHVEIRDPKDGALTGYATFYPTDARRIVAMGGGK